MRGRAALAGLLLVVLALILFFATRHHDAAPSAPPVVEPAAPVATAAPVMPGPQSFGSAPASETAPFVPAAAPPITLPPDTEALQAEFVPGTTEWEEVPLLEDSALTMRFLPASYNVVAPKPIVLYLELYDPIAKKRVAIQAPHARVRPFDKPDAWSDALMVDDGTGADEVAGDHRYTAMIKGSDELVGHVVAEAVITTPEAGVRRIPQALIYTKGPRAKLTGKWKDEARDGHLYLSAEVQVDAAGTFTLMAELFGPNREPIALARTMTALDVGTRWMTLRVWGKAIRDAGVPGPYEVRDVLLTRDMNERGDYDPGPTILSAHHTAAYKLEEFSAAPYVEPTVDRGEEIGANHPSQANNPAPQYPASARATVNSH
ncbi:MAG TPA: hypothetical protein VFQ65_10035 [Kofleriaceae bacterium]|nr:hypothetical protein [Kofleriaceae bacterium]